MVQQPGLGLAAEQRAPYPPAPALSFRDCAKGAHEMTKPKRKPARGSGKPRIKDFLDEEAIAKIGERAAEWPASEAMGFIMLKHEEDTAGSHTTQGVASASLAYTDFNRAKGPEAKAKQTKKLEALFPDWQATAKERWTEQIRERRELGTGLFYTVKDMAKEIQRDYVGKPKPSLTIVMRALRGHRPTLSMAKRKSPSAKIIAD